MHESTTVSGDPNVTIRVASISGVAQLLLALIGFYRRFVSPLLGPRCRFISHLQRLWAGGDSEAWPLARQLAHVKRLLRCIPGRPADVIPFPTEAPAMTMDLTLYSRQGCCLCEGLEQRLGQLDLTALDLQLAVIDIDASDTPAELKAPFDLEVPVLSLAGRVLPRVSPRLSR